MALTGLKKNANFPGRSLHFQQISHYVLNVYLHVKSHNFPQNGQISREGASQIPHLFPALDVNAEHFWPLKYDTFNQLDHDFHVFTFYCAKKVQQTDQRRIKKLMTTCKVFIIIKIT